MRNRIFQTFFICAALVLFCMAQLYAQGTAKLSAKITSELTSKAWPVYVIYQNMIRGKMKSGVKSDMLTFTDDVVFSQLLSAEGYSKGGSVYRAKMVKGGTYIWESILLHENQADVILMKGELKDGVMKGVMVYQRQGKPSETVNFTTVKPK